MNNHDFKRRKMYFRLSCTSCLLDMECGEGLVWPLNLSAGGKTHKKTSPAKSLWRAQSTKRAGRAALADPGSPTFHAVLNHSMFPFLSYLSANLTHIKPDLLPQNLKKKSDPYVRRAIAKFCSLLSQELL